MAHDVYINACVRVYMCALPWAAGHDQAQIPTDWTDKDILNFILHIIKCYQYTIENCALKLVFNMLMSHF